MHATLVLARQTCLEAWHGRLVTMLLVMVAFGVGLQWFVGAVALIEGAASSIAITAPTIRLAAVILVASIGANLICREFTERRIELLLSAPISRPVWVAGRMSGMIVVAILVALCAGGSLWFSLPAERLAVWTLSLAMELSLVGALAVTVSVALKRQVISLLAVLMLYLTARLIGVIEMLARSDIPGLVDSGAAGWLTGLLAAVLPSLSLFAQTPWLFDDLPAAIILQALASGAVQFAITLAILLVACSLDFAGDLD